MALITDKDMPAQEPLIDAAFVKFNGKSGGTLEDPPELEEERTYIVKAKCVAHHKDKTKDEGDRLTVTMAIQAVYERGKMPIVDEQQPMLFDEAMALEEQGADDDEDPATAQHLARSTDNVRTDGEPTPLGGHPIFSNE